jgi:hypothetical protein
VLPQQQLVAALLALDTLHVGKIGSLAVRLQGIRLTAKAMLKLRKDMHIEPEAPAVSKTSLESYWPLLTL